MSEQDAKHTSLEGGTARETAHSEGLEAIGAEHSRYLAELGAESAGERTAKRVVPWIVSIALHGILIGLGFLVTWSVVQMSRDEEPVIVIADFDSLIFDPIAELDLEAEQEQEIETELDLLPLDQPFEDMMPNFESEIVPAMPEAPIGGQPVDFAPAPERGSASFMGVSTTNAQEIVYVIDASGAMIAYLQFILRELKNSLEALSPQQSFAIIFFHRNEAVLVPTGGRGLTSALPREKERALAWIDENIVPAGLSNPIPAFEEALRLGPDAVFVLSANITSSGRFEVDQEELLSTLDRLNPVDRVTGLRPAQINCIQFLDPDPLRTMEVIVERHGGDRGYRFFSREDLGLQTR